MKGFVNTVLGLPFEEEAEAPEWQRLYERRESFRISIVPEQGLFLTAGVDVQKDRIEVEVVAWGRGKESWSVDYRVIEGDTARREVLARAWPHVSGHTLPIRVMCVDAGYATQDVYAWGCGSTRRRAGARRAPRRGSRAPRWRSRAATRIRRCCCRCPGPMPAAGGAGSGLVGRHAGGRGRALPLAQARVADRGGAR